jgi:hypothetical protein
MEDKSISLLNRSRGGLRREPNGIGHNLGRALVESVRSRIAEYSDALIRAEMTTRGAQLAALVAIYRLFVHLEERPRERVKFFTEHGLKSDPRNRHAAQPLVKFFIVADGLTPELANKVTYWAGAISEARYNGIVPDDLEDFIRETPRGIQGAYALAAKRLSGKVERGKRVDEFEMARSLYEAEIEPVELPLVRLTSDLQPGNRLAVVSIDETGVARVTAVLDRDQKAVDQLYHRHVSEWTKKRQKPIQTSSSGSQKGLRRRWDHKQTKSGKPIVLADDHKAVVDGRTRYLKLVRSPSPDEWCLKRGEHNRKIGGLVTKGKFKNFPVFTLTLEERATCPRSCEQWHNCYGNVMASFRAYRYQAGPELESQLDRELSVLNSEPATRNGFLLRLHVLGDFYDVGYVEKWRAWLERFTALHVFGFTAWQPDTEIGAAIKELRDEQWKRFAIRFSNSTEPERSARVIREDDPHPDPHEAIVCPAELSKTDGCGTCALCWTTNKPIVFVEH